MEDKIIDTDEKRKHGENRCPDCGASDVTLDIKKGKLRCNYCGKEFEPKEVEGIDKEAKDVVGVKKGSGTKDIKQTDDVITLKCGGCGAEVVINTNETTNARCHWCRSILSINSQIDNGSIPDEVLPFKLEKKEAESRIQAFVQSKKFFAHPKFVQEFKTDNIMGVYFPYLLIDCNAHAIFSGEGGDVARTYTIVTGKDKDGKDETKTVHDIDVYDVERDFDIAIDDLTIESSKDKLDKKNKSKTTNIINSIMPFDTENCVKYESNYLVGYTSEKRDINISDIEEKINQSLVDIARFAINTDLKKYDAGIHWDDEKLEIKGKQIVSAYLPVWLYSYQDEKNILHYVAVNARTGETMGSIPMNKRKLFGIAFLIDFIILAIILLLYFLTNISAFFVFFLFLLTGPIYYAIKGSSYRNSGARHKYELETKSTITNLVRKDVQTDTLRERSFSTIDGVNNNRLVGEYTNYKVDIQESDKK